MMVGRYHESKVAVGVEFTDDNEIIKQRKFETNKNLDPFFDDSLCKVETRIFGD